MKLVYVAHPIGHELAVRQANLAKLERWFVWLLKERPEDALVLPYLAYVQALAETPVNRARGIRDDLAVLRRCDAIVLVGGRMSPGMTEELGIARLHGLEVDDLTHLGVDPPEVSA